MEQNHLLLPVLAAYLHGETCDDLFSSFSETDWDSFLNLAWQHMVLPVVCLQVRSLPSFVAYAKKEQVRRGADIVKIVAGANRVEEEMENLRIVTMLKKELSVPFIFLAAGTHAKVLRMIGPMLGCFACFAVYEHDANAVPTQPTVAAAKAVRDNFDYLPDLPLSL
jgi:hypothetical protein